MTTEKQKTDLTRSALCILIALAFGAYLGSPGPKVWAEPVSGLATAVSEQITRLEHLHNNEEDTNDTVDLSVPEDSALIADPSAPEDSMVKADPSVPEDSIKMNADRGATVNRKEMDVLVHLINAEAYGLSYKAKLAVGQVVMNRWTGPYYGDDLLAIMTAPHQFTPIHNKTAYQKEIEPDSIKAANAVLSGTGVKELTSDTYYFVNPDFTEDKTIENEMTFVCEIEGIHFFRPPTR